MRNEYYLTISPELSFHFFGDQSIIIDSDGIEYLYDSTQTSILSLCDGTKTIKKLLETLAFQYNVDNDTKEKFNKAIVAFLDIQIKKNVVVEQNTYKMNSNIYGEKGKYYPNALSVEITNRCNFLCPHCYKNALAKGQDIDENIINYIKSEFGGKVKQLQLTGGEPFLNKKIASYISDLSELFEIRIPTNGSLLYTFNDEIIRKINFVQFSLYGTTPEEYKEFTGSKDAYYAVMKSIEKVKNCGVDNIASLVLNKDNINRMEEYIEGAIQLGATKIKFGVPTLAGRAFDDVTQNNRFMLTHEDLRAAYRNSRELKRKYHGKISVGIWSHRSQEPKKPLINGEEYNNMLPCGAGYMSYVISQSGRLRPCELLSEAYFDLGSYKKLSDYVKGEFFTDYSGMIGKLHSHMCKYGVGLECFCSPIATFYERIKHSENKEFHQ